MNINVLRFLESLQQILGLVQRFSIRVWVSVSEVDHILRRRDIVKSVRPRQVCQPTLLGLIRDLTDDSLPLHIIG